MLQLQCFHLRKCALFLFLAKTAGAILTILEESSVLLLWVDLPQLDSSVHARRGEQLGVLVPNKGVDDVGVALEFLDDP